MDKKSKELQIIDLCPRLPYGFIIHRYSDNCDIVIESNCIDVFAHFLEYSEGEDFKPYLRSMSSMTEEEKKELSERYVWKINGSGIEIKYHSDGYWDNDIYCSTEEYLWLFNWLNAHHFDYRGLIEKGLALEALPGMYDKH